jgi:hypothetical protein
MCEVSREQFKLKFMRFNLLVTVYSLHVPLFFQMAGQLRANQAGTRAACFIDNTFRVFNLSNRGLDPIWTAEGISILDFAFLPVCFGHAILAIQKDDGSSPNILLYKEDPYDNDRPSYEAIPVNDVEPLPESLSQIGLRVSLYPSELLFGFIIEGSISLYHLDPGPISCNALPIRRYRLPEPLLWFDFATSDTIFGATETQLIQFKVNSNQQVGTANLPSRDLQFTSAAISPTNPNRVAVLLSNGGVYVFEFTGDGTGLTGSPKEIPGCRVKGAHGIGWSPFGTALSVEADTYHVFNEVANDHWVAKVEEEEEEEEEEEIKLS